MQIHRALLKDVGSLFTIDESALDGQLFGLTCSDLQTIKPNYEAMIKGGHLKVTEMGVQHVGKLKNIKIYMLPCIQSRIPLRIFSIPLLHIYTFISAFIFWFSVVSFFYFSYFLSYQEMNQYHDITACLIIMSITLIHLVS